MLVGKRFTFLLFFRSRTPFQGGPLSETSFQDGPLSRIPFQGRNVLLFFFFLGLKLHFKADQFKSRTTLRADYDISKSGTPLEADYCLEEADRDPELEVNRRFAFFQRLLEEFEVISFPDVYQTNFED
ncbi:hypothetical protein RclHR1_00310055 [Rhizophagus clarus]|uniref:Uncharacterized protein n=1 Tax=Rhizophagus clarus TaxID=94130 RepID=A0A2Z6R6A7_9GLOM|nr:hypothetical protein RclHR1_00310055 [Rhizophagus clarus]